MKQRRPTLLLGQLRQRTVKEGSLIAFIQQLRTVCFGSDDSGISYGPFKQVVAVKSMNNYTNNKPYEPHDFKQVKIKFEVTKAIARRSPNRTATLIKLLIKAQPTALDWATYCALPADKQLMWEQKADELNQSMISLMNSKNKTTKKGLRLAYSHRGCPSLMRRRCISRRREIENKFLPYKYRYIALKVTSTCTQVQIPPQNNQVKTYRYRYRMQ